MKPIGSYLLILFLLAGPALFSQDGEGPAGTGVEAARRELLSLSLEREGIPFEVRPLFSAFGGFGSSLSVHIPARPGAEEEEGFVLAIPLFGSDDPGEGFPWGIAGGLSFIRKLRERGTDREVTLVFLGDERSLLPEDIRKQSHTGLKEFLSSQGRPEDTALLYLDSFESPNTLIVHHGGGKTLAPLQILEPFLRLCALWKIPTAFAVGSNVLYKLDLVPALPAMELSLGAGISSLAIQGKRDPAAPFGSGISADTLGELLVEYSRSPLLSEKSPDSHYSVFRFFGKTLFLSEFETLIVLLGLTALFFLIFLIYSIVSRGKLGLQWRGFLRRSWIIPVVFALSALSLGGADLFVTLILRAFSLPMNRAYPGGAALTLIIALGLLSLANPLLEGINISRKAAFYGNAAVVVIILESLAAAFMDITFMPSFVWAFVFTLLSTLIPFPLPVYAIAFIMPLPAAGTLIAGLESEFSGLQELLREGRLWLILILALLSLPPVLIFRRGEALQAKRKKTRRPPTPLPFLRKRFVFLSLAVAALLFYGASLLWQAPPAPVRRIIEAEPGSPASLELTLSERIFLQRRLLEIRLEAPGQPVRLDLALDYQSSPFAIYSAPMPFVQGDRPADPSGQEGSVEFLLGENPPNPFSTSLVLPLNFQGSLRVDALYTRYDPALDRGDPPAGDDYVLRLRRIVPLPP